MKVAITTPSDSNDTLANPRFGRANYFCIIDTKTGTKQFIPNPATQAAHGAGVQAGQILVDNNVEAAISAKYGPNAEQVLHSANIKMFLYPDTGTLGLDELIQALTANQLKEI